MDTGSRPELSVSFHNFYGGFDPETHFLTRALRDRFNVKVERAGRDIQFSSVFGRSALPMKRGARPLRVWWTGEAQDPHFQVFDLYFAFWPNKLMGDRWHRLPLWVLYLEWWGPKEGPHAPARLLEPRTGEIGSRPRFCNFIYSAQPSVRTEFFMRLNAARGVDSFGPMLNNRGSLARGREGKLHVLRDSRFTVAFENVTAPGYVTEKIVHPLLAGSIPIYWGAGEAKSDFNAQAFIYANDFGSMDDLIAHVLKLDGSPEAMAEMASAPRLHGGTFSYEHTPEFYADRISDALSRDFRPTAGLQLGPWRSRGEARRMRLAYRLRRIRNQLLGRPKPTM